MPNRSDYLTIFETGGPSALNQVLRDRLPNPTLYERELLRMEKLGVWEIAWDIEESGRPVVVARLPDPKIWNRRR